MAEILSEHWEGFARQHRHMLSKAHYRAVRSVLACRTPVLGGRLYRCGSCQRKHFAYHSCNHRSCPQCGALEQKLWSEKQEARLLPSSYFMVTFTLPEQLRPLCQSHPKELYDLMLKQSAQTLKDIIATKTKELSQVSPPYFILGEESCNTTRTFIVSFLQPPCLQRIS